MTKASKEIHRRPTKSAEPAAIRRKLLAWYDLHHRELPWRASQDAYRVWISEIMLQQTRVQAVIPFYGKFLRRFPNLETLAAAPEQDVLACWSGLGYYSRARSLQRAAQQILQRHGGVFPRRLEDALALPGVGEYTSAAVLSIAYDAPLPLVDGNVARVLSRLFALAADLRTGPGKQKLQQRAWLLLARRRPGDFNQALMELGATVCLARQPECSLCPLRSHCLAFLRDHVARYPPARRRTKPVSRHFLAALILDRKGRCLLVRRAPGERWMAGFWELPMREETEPVREGSKAASAEDGISLGMPLGTVRHTITSNNLRVNVFQAALDRPLRRPRERWVPLSRIHDLPLTTITRKALRLRYGEEFEE